MAVRSQHVRQSSTLVSKTVNGRYICFFSADSYTVDMARVRRVATKTAKSNLIIDDDTRYITVNLDNTINQIKY